jgi:XRE family transcriptional regulator, regulator of sulfur utilization
MQLKKLEWMATRCKPRSNNNSVNFVERIYYMLNERIVNARKSKGLTQEQLAEMTNITVRTIQRIESGQTTPRTFTLKALADALDIKFEELITETEDIKDPIPDEAPLSNMDEEEDGKHFLKMLCLSCFSYLVIPFIHFLIPARLLKKTTRQNPKIISFARKVIRVQLYWMAAFWLLMLATLAYNLIRAAYFQKTLLLNYLVPFFIMYFINAAIISTNLFRIDKTSFTANLNK